MLPFLAIEEKGGGGWHEGDRAMQDKRELYEMSIYHPSKLSSHCQLLQHNAYWDMLHMCVCTG
jgi:hypothetical protein